MEGTLTFSPPAFGPSNNSTQAQFTHGPPPGSANKRFVGAGVARAVDGASLLHGPLRVDRNAETEKKLNGWTKGRGTKHQGTGMEGHRSTAMVGSHRRGFSRTVSVLLRFSFDISILIVRSPNI
jgi:hypothetical protein